MSASGKPLALQHLILLFSSRFTAKEGNFPPEGDGRGIHRLAPSKLVDIWSAVTPGFGDERRRIFTHCGRETFQYNNAGLDFGEPLINCPHYWIIGAKGVMRTDEHQSLRPFLVGGNKRYPHRTVAWAPRLNSALKFQ